MCDFLSKNIFISFSNDDLSNVCFVFTLTNDFNVKYTKKILKVFFSVSIRNNFLSTHFPLFHKIQFLLFSFELNTLTLLEVNNCLLIYLSTTLFLVINTEGGLWALRWEPKILKKG